MNKIEQHQRQWKPNVTVAAVIERDGRFLLVEEEADGRIVLNQPAGHLEKDEDLLHAVRREVLEETGREFRPQALVGVYLYPHPADVGITYLRFCFSGDCGEADPQRPLDHGIRRALWLDQAALERERARMRSPLVLHCLQDYLQGRRYPLELLDHAPAAPA